ncbi:MAG: hypothetical protein DI538_09880 [Azospira oryzae]|jgi:hypothetical protein|nr:MAG: hypothetical protein DI538_09880 [Azospira oryzae]
MKRLIFISLVSIVFFGCREEDNATPLSAKGASAESVYLTRDQNDNPVAVWTERKGEDLALLFAVSNDRGKSFSEKTSLPLTSDVATHSEGMPKVAFKKDGTIIAAYEKKTPTQTNKYAGAIYYRVSSDNGKNWLPEKFLHSDTIAGRSRSYFDIERLSNGEIGAAWLDVKLDKETGGRSVRFASTEGSGDFGNEMLVDSSACQCCRLDVYSDLAGRVNVAYRGLMKGVMGKPIRDMMLATSSDNGKTFTRPSRISFDNWSIDGCPHTGPSLCSSKGGLYSLWYTEGNGTGIYYSFKQNGENEFQQRALVSNSGRHPQLSANDERFIMVWEETSGNEAKKITNIFYQVSNDIEVKRECLTPKTVNAFSPVVTTTKDGFLVAYLMENGDGIEMYIRKI